MGIPSGVLLMHTKVKCTDSARRLCNGSFLCLQLISWYDNEWGYSNRVRNQFADVFAPLPRGAAGICQPGFAKMGFCLAGGRPHQVHCHQVKSSCEAALRMSTVLQLSGTIPTAALGFRAFIYVCSGLCFVCLSHNLAMDISPQFWSDPRQFCRLNTARLQNGCQLHISEINVMTRTRLRTLNQVSTVHIVKYSRSTNIMSAIARHVYHKRCELS